MSGVEFLRLGGTVVVTLGAAPFFGLIAFCVVFFFPVLILDQSTGAIDGWGRYGFPLGPVVGPLITGVTGAALLRLFRLPMASVPACVLAFAYLVAMATAPLRRLSMTASTVAFVVICFFAAAANMWIGVSQARYSFQEELPIFLLIFLLPAAVAIFAKWKFL